MVSHERKKWIKLTLLKYFTFWFSLVYSFRVHFTHLLILIMLSNNVNKRGYSSNRAIVTSWLYPKIVVHYKYN